MAKRTYSQRDKRRSAYGHKGFPSHEDSQKRQKVANSDELHLPPSPPPSRGGKSSLLKKSLKVFGGPISIPEDELNLDPAPKISSGLSVFDKVAKEGVRAAKPKQQTIYGSRDDFEDTMKSKKKGKPSSHLPTPPAEVQKKSAQEARRAQKPSTPDGTANMHVPRRTQMVSNTTETLPSSKVAITKKQPKEPYEPKAYKAEKSPTPRKNIRGDRLRVKSKEAEL